MAVYLTTVYLIGVQLMGVHLMHLMGIHFIGMHFMGVYLTGVYFIGVYFIYESSLRVKHGWRESPNIDTQGGLKASDCGRLGRQAAGHPWSALRVVKSCRKRLPNGLGAAEAKAAALHPKWYQSSLSKLSTRGG